MSRIIAALLGAMPACQVKRVLIGLHWTVVVVHVEGQERCGLASTLRLLHHHGQPDVPLAGQLEALSGMELARLAKSNRPVECSSGMAAINAMLPRNPRACTELNAEQVLASHGAGKKVALVGHFPFVPRLRERVGELRVFERHPQPGDLPAGALADGLPQAEVVAITGTALINHTLERLLTYVSKDAMVILLGPTTPLSPILFDYGIDALCGSVVMAIGPVLRVAGQGGNFRQVRRAGVKTVTMFRPGFNGITTSAG